MMRELPRLSANDSQVTTMFDECERAILIRRRQDLVMWINFAQDKFDPEKLKSEYKRVCDRINELDLAAEVARRLQGGGQ